ncbi:AAA domain-containing protein [Clostridium tertium]|uniref:Aerobic cobaltochelatase subunit CobS n=1 Tax=Clostridium tertium TaxID=1559 RepID=A0A6N2Y841_9CLOT
MKLFKIAYKVARENTREIYKGFGFKHLSDATQYYVHINNESFNGRTTLCQPIGEAIILFTSMISSIIHGDLYGDYYISDNANTVYLEINFPEDYIENTVIEQNIRKYKVLLQGNNITLAAYDYYGKLIYGNMEHLHILYKLLPSFMVLLAREFEVNEDFKMLMEEFIKEPVADIFVNIHEDFYQNHKNQDYNLNYSELPYVDTSSMFSFASKYKIVIDNKNEMKQENIIEIIPFSSNTFKKEDQKYIPKLSEEFIIPKNLHSVCNAISKGDCLAVLFHGPSGTGKTMACKLICKEIGLPIMETINCTENLDEFVLGKYMPEGNQINFKESFVTYAIRNGGAVVFEEINFAKPQYLAFLNSLLDDNGFVRLDNGDVIKRHENFRFFATMNIGYFGTKELNQSLYNRFNVIIETPDLPKEAICRMLALRVPECENVLDKVIGVYSKIKNKIEAEELDVVISPRNLENWVKLAKYEGYILAAEKTIIPIAKGDRILEETIRGIIMLYRWK